MHSAPPAVGTAGAGGAVVVDADVVVGAVVVVVGGRVVVDVDVLAGRRSAARASASEPESPPVTTRATATRARTARRAAAMLAARRLVSSWGVGFGGRGRTRGLHECGPPAGRRRSRIPVERPTWPYTPE